MILLLLTLLLVLTGCRTQTKTAEGIPIDGGVDEQIEGTLPDMAADECILIGSGISIDFNTGGYDYEYVGFYDNTFTPLVDFYNVTLDLLPGIYKKDIVFTVMTSKYEKKENRLKQGLYDLAKRRYLFEPIYRWDQLTEITRFTELNPESKVYAFGKTPDQMKFYDGFGKEIYQKFSRAKEPIFPIQVGDYTWIHYESKKEIEVYDKKEQLVETIPASGFMNENNDSYMVPIAVDGSLDRLYNDAGQEIQFRDQLFKQIDEDPNQEIRITYANAKTGLIQFTGEDFTILYNLHKQKVVDTVKGDDNYFSVYNTYYSRNDKAYYYLNGKQIKSNKIKDTLVSALEDHIITTDGKETVVYEVSTKAVWRWDGVYEYVNLCEPFSQYFIASGSLAGYKQNLYFKGRLVLRDVTDELLFRGENYLVVRSIDESKNQRTILDTKGNIVYQTKDGEELFGIARDYLILKRGNYVGVAELNGEFIYKRLDPLMGDD